MRVLAFLSILSTALAATHTVEVGDDGKFAFSPDTLQAAVGDKVTFEFYPGGHSVAQSTFASPCQPSTGGIWSGTFSPTSDEDSNVFVVTIANTDPIWIYCAQIGHCNAGMAMVINPPAGGNTLAAYKSAAADATLKVPTTVAGGVVQPASENSSSGSESESSTTATASSSSGAASTSAEAASTSAASTEAASTSAAPTSAASTEAASTAAATPTAPSTPESSSGSPTAASSAPAFTGASNTNGIGAAVAVLGAGMFAFAMM